MYLSLMGRKVAQADCSVLLTQLFWSFEICRVPAGYNLGCIIWVLFNLSECRSSLVKIYYKDLFAGRCGYLEL